MKQHEQDEIIARHKRKKGKKNFIIQRRMTAVEADARIQKEYDRIMREREWTDGYGKYETEKAAKQALEKIERDKKATTGHWHYHRGFEHKIINISEEKCQRKTP